MELWRFLWIKINFSQNIVKQVSKYVWLIIKILHQTSKIQTSETNQTEWYEILFLINFNNTYFCFHFVKGASQMLKISLQNITFVMQILQNTILIENKLFGYKKKQLGICGNCRKYISKMKLWRHAHYLTSRERCC